MRGWCGWWRVGFGCAARGAVGGSDELGQVGDVLQGGGEGVCPWPVERQAQSVAAAVVDEAARHGEELVGDGGCDGELARGVGAAEAGGPAGEVVREHAAGEPGAVGGESSGGAAAEPGALFEVSDGELDCGVAAVVGVGGTGVEVVSVGDEAVVAPVGPQRVRRTMSRSFAGASSSPCSLSPRRPASMVLSATCASPPRVYSMLAQSSSSMAAMAALTLALCGIVIE